MKYITIILLLLVLSCKKDSSSDKIDSDIKIKMWETVDGTKQMLLLYCSTEKEYPCYNYGIVNSVQKYSNKVDIEFSEIIIPDICLTAIGPANTTLDLGTVSNGTYDLEINVDGKKSTGQLIVNSDYYKIDLDKQRQIQITYSTLNKVPTNTIWGTIGYHTSSTATLVQTFIDSLQLLGATSKTYLSGEYGYFQINTIGQILPPENHGYYFIQPYIYNYTANTSDIETLVKNYGKNFGDSLNIILYTTKGETFRSWTQ